MSREQTVGEWASRWAAVLGGLSTALTLEQVLGLAIGLGGMAAAWWLAIMRNRREQIILKMQEEEHEMRMQMNNVETQFKRESA